MVSDKCGTWLHALAILVFSAVMIGKGAAAPAGWPATISGQSGFNDLGKVIMREPGFPASGSPVEKARYVFSRMADAASTYGLKSGSGGIVSNTVIGLYRLTNDPEGAECLKGAVGWGNCGEWSYAFSEILDGAGVVSRVAFGDSAGGAGASMGFGGTDTMVIVEERSPDGKLSRRVFDAFRAAFESGKEQPTAESLKDWGDLPLTDGDRWQDETTTSWQSVLGKPFIKDAVTEQVIDLAPDARVDPRHTPRPSGAARKFARSIAILLDASGSMGDNNKMAQAKASAQRVLGQVGPSVEVALIVFSDCGNITVAQEFTTDAGALAAALAKVQPAGSTPLAAGITFAKDYIRRKASGASVDLVVLSDGQETCSGDPVAAARQ